MKIHGAITVPPTASGKVLFFIPMDGTTKEFIPLDACPPEVMEVLANMSDETESTILGVIVDAAA